ncbi:DEKNAAC100734 [Brettanomyces naardenensis]|uniref:[acyl-carrier-protein] S-malonyltransferase n=1 Tax=Brettanomyces naardenensis TaxID=13370 RepID=A0A448YFF2_BRENA|nr:DEKNAAC100734 [Brettanomyces naardenensis]
MPTLTTSMKRILVCPGQGKFDFKTLAALSKNSTLKPIEELLERADETIPQLRLSQYIRQPEIIAHDSVVQNHLQQTHVQQPLLILTSYLENEILKVNQGIDLLENADYMIGHSLGEITCLVLQGIIPFERGLQVAYQRGKLMESIVKKEGEEFGMYALLFQPTYYEYMKRILKELDVNIANYNTYSQVVISGVKSQLESNIEELQKIIVSDKVWKTRVKAIDLNVHIPFHHPVLEPIEKSLTDIILGNCSELKVPVISNYDGEIEVEAAKQIKKIIQVTSKPVYFSKCLEHFVKRENTTYEFVHYGSATQGLVKRFYADFEKLGRHAERPNFTNKLIGTNDI